MITLRRADERHHDRRRTREVWLTFHPGNRADPLSDGFGALEFLDEHRLQPGANLVRRPPLGAEIVTYVREGALAYHDPMGRSGVIHAGEFQCMTTRRGLHHGEENGSKTDGAQVFRISLRKAETEPAPSHQEKRFSTAERRGGLRVVASPDARQGSLCIHQDALMYSALLEPGRHVIHQLSQRRSAWLHLVQGEGTVGDIVLTTGDGVGVTAERAVSLTARENTEILLLDLGDRA